MTSRTTFTGPEELLLDEGLELDDDRLLDEDVRELLELRELEEKLARELKEDELVLLLELLCDLAEELLGELDEDLLEALLELDELLLELDGLGPQSFSYHERGMMPRAARMLRMKHRMHPQPHPASRAVCARELENDGRVDDELLRSLVGGTSPCAAANDERSGRPPVAERNRVKALAGS